MAAEDYTNTVPLGQAGTGAAYILPQSQAIGEIGSYIDDSAKRRQAALLLQQQNAQKLASAWQDNQLKIKGGTLYQPEINERAAKVMEMGMQLQKARVNPNAISSDPKYQKQLEDYQTQKALLLRDVDIRDAIVKRAEANEKLIAEQPAGYFEPESVQAYHNYVSGRIPLSEISVKGLQMPELKRTFNLQPVIDKLPAVPIETTRINTKTGIKSKLILPNKEAHNEIANNLLKNDPQVQADISKKAGMPYSEIGNQTDVNVIKKEIDDFWRSQPNVPQLAGFGITSYNSPQYKSLLENQSKQRANAAKVKEDYKKGIVNELNAKVHQTNDQTLNYDYQQEMRAADRMGMEKVRFQDWAEKQQYEAGNFTLGNQDSYVPVIKSWANPGKAPKDEDGNTKAAGSVPEAGASLYGVNLPAVSAVVRPSMVTDMKSGKTRKNTSPIDVKISQIQMVPVFSGLSESDPRNGSEISAKQLKEIVDGKHSFAKLKNITFQPYAYGISSEKDANNVHTVNKQIKFSYDALKGSNVKKINTRTFDEATQGLKQLQSNPKFKQMSPQDQLDFISKKYNVKLD